MSDCGSNFPHLAIPEGLIPVAATLFWRHWSTVLPGFLLWYSVIQLSQRYLFENKIQIQGSHFPFLFNVADQSYRCTSARLSQGPVVLAHFKHPLLSSLTCPCPQSSFGLVYVWTALSLCWRALPSSLVVCRALTLMSVCLCIPHRLQQHQTQQLLGVFSHPFQQRLCLSLIYLGRNSLKPRTRHTDL